MKRVLIVCSRPLLRHGIERLVGQEEGVEIVGQERDLGQAVSRAGELRPDAVIVACDKSDDELAHHFLRMLRGGVCRQIITLNTQDNVMGIYYGEERNVESVADLVDAIRNLGPAALS